MPTQGAAPQPTVLVIDDEPLVRDVLTDFLREQGYATLTAANGVAALGVIERQLPAAVLLDITMPGLLDGLQTLRVIKAVRPGLPVIMVTANADVDVAKTTLQEGAFDYVMKPFDFGRLGEVLSGALVFSGKAPPG